MAEGCYRDREVIENALLRRGMGAFNSKNDPFCSSLYCTEITARAEELV